MIATLDIQQKDEPRLNFREYNILQNQIRLMRATKDFEDKRSSVYWAGRQNIPSSMYIKLLGQFYQELSAGNYSEMNGFLKSILGEVEKPFSYGLHLRWKTREKDVIEDDMPLEILADYRAIVVHPHFRDFERIKISTPYAEFGLDSFNGAWNPTDGRLWLTSHQPLGMPLARLFAQTSLYEGRAEGIRPHLDQLFDF